MNFNISVLLDVQANLPETSPFMSAQMAAFFKLGMYNFALGLGHMISLRKCVVFSKYKETA